MLQGLHSAGVIPVRRRSRAWSRSSSSSRASGGRRTWCRVRNLQVGPSAVSHSRSTQNSGTSRASTCASCGRRLSTRRSSAKPPTSRADASKRLSQPTPPSTSRTQSLAAYSNAPEEKSSSARRVALWSRQAVHDQFDGDAPAEPTQGNLFKPDDRRRVISGAGAASPPKADTSATRPWRRARLSGR